MQKISPCIWYDNNALEAAERYVSVFENSSVDFITYYLNNNDWPSELPDGSVMTVRFTLCGQEFDSVNGGPIFRPNPSVSFFVDCENEAQVEKLWAELGSGGKILMELGTYPFSEKFGWLEDCYGVSWQLSLSRKKQAITPYIMFSGDVHGRAEEAMGFYIDVFSEGEILDIHRYTGEMDEPEGTVMHATFKLGEKLLMAVDSAFPHKFAFGEGLSFIVSCKDQAEIDHFWNKLTEGGQEQPCGWLKDKFGLSWQIVPENMEQLSNPNEPARVKRVNEAMLKMKKLDIAILEKAYEMA